MSKRTMNRTQAVTHDADVVQQPAEAVSPAERAARYLQEQPVDKRGDVRGIPTGHAHVWMVPSELTERQAEDYRNRWRSKGYDPQPDAYVVGAAGAEVWSTPQEVADMHHEAWKRQHIEKRRKQSATWAREYGKVERIG